MHRPVGPPAPASPVTQTQISPAPRPQEAQREVRAAHAREERYKGDLDFERSHRERLLKSLEETRATLEHQTQRSNQLLEQMVEMQRRGAAVEARVDEREVELRRERQRATTLEAQMAGERGVVHGGVEVGWVGGCMRGQRVGGVGVGWVGVDCCWLQSVP